MIKIFYKFFYFSEYKECFSLYDRDGDGLISIEQLKLVLRSLEQCPTQMDMSQISSKLGIYIFRVKLFYILLSNFYFKLHQR